MAALQGGMSIYMGLGPIHALAHAFGNSPLHHGALVTIATPAVMRFYRGHVDDKLAAIAAAMGLAPGTDVAAGVARLNARLGLPAGIAALGYDGDDVDTLAATAHASYFNNPAPRRPTIGQYRDIVAEALG
jgi:4-hydroxybutyrate dehydrogenase